MSKILIKTSLLFSKHSQNTYFIYFFYLFEDAFIDDIHRKHSCEYKTTFFLSFSRKTSKITSVENIRQNSYNIKLSDADKLHQYIYIIFLSILHNIRDILTNTYRGWENNINDFTGSLLKNALIIFLLWAADL